MHKKENEYKENRMEMKLNTAKVYLIELRITILMFMVVMLIEFDKWTGPVGISQIVTNRSHALHPFTTDSEGIIPFSTSRRKILGEVKR